MKTGTGENWTRHLEPDVAHEVCNTMLEVLFNLKLRRGFDNACDQLRHDGFMARLEQDICNIIEPHIRFAYADGYNDADFEAQP